MLGNSDTRSIAVFSWWVMLPGEYRAVNDHLSVSDEGKEGSEPNGQFPQRNTQFPLAQEIPELDHQAQSLHVDQLKPRPELADTFDFALAVDA